MTKQRIVDLSLPIIDGGGFGKPARLNYYDHKQRGKVLAATLDIDPQDIEHKANAMEEFSFLTTHTGTHFDAPYHYTDTTKGKPALTVDLIPLDWCFGPGIWLDLSHKAPGTDITVEDIKVAVDAIQYKIRPKDIVLIKTGAGASYGQNSCDNMNAGMTREATLWLADHGVRLVGIDACCWDRPPELQLDSIRNGERKGRYMEGHRAAGSRGICILEWLTNLDQLPQSLSNIFGCEVRLKYSVQNISIHPDTIIADYQFSILTGLRSFLNRLLNKWNKMKNSANATATTVMKVRIFAFVCAFNAARIVVIFSFISSTYTPEATNNSHSGTAFA